MAALVVGMNGGIACFIRIASQLMSLKKGCYLISATPDSQQPILSSGSALSSLKSKSAASSEQCYGIFVVSPKLMIIFILSTIDMSLLNLNGLLPSSISYNTRPNANQSTDES